MNATHTLNADELFHLAMAATQRGQAEQAIVQLKRCLELAPDHARARYVLGGQYAEIGMLDQAIDLMRGALALAPELDTARFQLGLLQLTCGRLDEARHEWSLLSHLPDTHYLSLFVQGLQCVADNRLEQGASALRLGMQANTVNQPLNVDMASVMANVERALEAHGAQSAAAPLSAYGELH
ncbi:MAG TPA: tetratricopeptide repeat protein [Burkholderiaceae bacterium]